MEITTTLPITPDLTDEARFTNEKGIEMSEITKEAIGQITVSVAGMGIDEFRDRIKPDAAVQFVLTEEEEDSLFGSEPCDTAAGAIMQFFGDMLSLGKVEHDCLGKTWEAYNKWDPTTRPVKYNGNGSDAEVNGARQRPFTWRIAAKMLQIKDAARYWRIMRSAFSKVSVAAHMFPAGFLADPPQGVAA